MIRFEWQENELHMIVPFNATCETDSRMAHIETQGGKIRLYVCGEFQLETIPELMDMLKVQARTCVMQCIVKASMAVKR